MTVVETVADDGGTAVLRLHAPSVAAAAAPGRFVTVATPVALLRRPFWIAGAGGATITLRIRVAGPASAWLSVRRPGDEVDVLGPLGRPIDLPPPGVHCVLSGPATHPVLSWLAALLPRRGVRVTTTPPGAAGAVQHALTAGGAARADAAGTTSSAAAPRGEPFPGVAGGASAVAPPVPVLVVVAGTADEQAAAVAAVAAAAGVRCLVATQPVMACGIGVCWTCAVPVTGGAPVRGCLDGPVVDAARIAWPEPAVAR